MSQIRKRGVAVVELYIPDDDDLYKRLEAKKDEIWVGLAASFFLISFAQPLGFSTTSNFTAGADDTDGLAGAEGEKGIQDLRGGAVQF